MSNFGAKLAELLERKKMRASELSRISGINDALISRWINAQQKFVSPEDLSNLCGSISVDPKEQAELVRAHLHDEIGGPGSELIDIRIRGHSSSSKDSAPPYKVALPLNLQRALDILARESLTDADVRAVVLGLANTLEPNRGEVSSARKEEIAAEGLAVVKGETKKAPNASRSK